VGDFATITRTQANSKFLIQANINIGYTGEQSNPDADNYAITLSRNGTAFTTTTRTSMSSYGQAGGVYGFTASDVPITGGGVYWGKYDSTYKTLAYTDTPSGNVGTTFTYGIALVNTGGGGLISYNRCYQNIGSGGITTLTIFEIAG